MIVSNVRYLDHEKYSYQVEDPNVYGLGQVRSKLSQLIRISNFMTENLSDMVTEQK